MKKLTVLLMTSSFCFLSLRIRSLVSINWFIGADLPMAKSTVPDERNNKVKMKQIRMTKAFSRMVYEVNHWKEAGFVKHKNLVIMFRHVLLLVY